MGPLDHAHRAFLRCGIQGFWEKKGYNRNADQKVPVLDERYLDTSPK